MISPLLQPLYLPESRPATEWLIRINGSDTPRIGFRPRDLIHTRCCNKQRAAANCVIQLHYGLLSIWCAPGKGCKDPEHVAAKKKRHFKNKSKSQRARKDRQ